MRLTARGIVEVDKKKTLEELNIDIDTLSGGSSKRVYFSCLCCNESFLREWKNRHQKHQCLTHKMINDVLHKWCNKCKNFRVISEFRSNTAQVDNLNYYCKSCDSKITKHKQKTNLKSWIGHRLSTAKFRADRSGGDFDLDTDFMVELWQKQDGLCFYTKIPLSFTRKDMCTASIDRVDSSRSYVRDNVVWCCKAINFMKSNYDYKDLVNFISQMAFSFNFLPRIECKLLTSNAVLPSRSRIEDAGYDLTSIVDIDLEPGVITQINTGVVMSAPEGIYFTIEGRSSLFQRGVVPARGIIDATYTGEMVVALINNSKKSYRINSGDRIAQLVIHRSRPFDVALVEEFSPEYSVRGTKGFGSSGK